MRTTEFGEVVSGLNCWFNRHKPDPRVSEACFARIRKVKGILGLRRVYRLEELAEGG